MYDARFTPMTTAAIYATREVSWGPSFYRGEQYDLDLGLYYLRARYYNPNTGRFMSRDPEDGKAKIPATLHKYLYADGDPVNRIDPSGKDGIIGYALDLGESQAAISGLRWTGIQVARVVLCVAGFLELYGPADVEYYWEVCMAE
jgi:RHS repeat-associated protein